MRKIVLTILAASSLISCTNDNVHSVTGTVYDATMNGVTVITSKNDTVFVSTINAKDAGYTGQSFVIDDTLSIDYKVMDGINIAINWKVKPTSKADLLIGSWIKPITGIAGEDGFLLNENGSAASINSATLLYKSWKREGDKIIMSIESIGNGQTISSVDTMKILKLDKDSLVLDNQGLVMRYHKAGEE